MKFPAKAVHSVSLEPRSRRRPHSGWFAGASALGALTLILAGCSSGSPSASSSSSSSSTAQAAGHKGGTFTILANSAFGVADPAQNYTLEQWQLLIDTHDGLTAFAKVNGVADRKSVV